MKFLRLPEVMELTALSRSSIYKLINENRFPPRVPLGGRAVAWVESEIQVWMNERLTLRDGQPINQITNPDTNK